MEKSGPNRLHVSRKVPQLGRVGSAQIGYLTSADPKDRKSWSGTHFHIFSQLKKRLGEVHSLGPWQPSGLVRLLKLRSAIELRMTGQRYNYFHSNALARAYGKHFDAALRNHKFDLLFAVAASTELAFTNVDDDTPVVYISDGTVAAMLDYYPKDYSDVSASSANESIEIERLAMLKAHTLIYSTHWAARSAIDDYGIPAERVHVIPFGANFEVAPDSAFALESKTLPPYRLLFPAVDWDRKGGPIALGVMECLSQAGFPIEMTVVGCIPPVTHPNLNVIPYLNKNDPMQTAQFLDLWRQSHAMLLPTRAECSAIVFAEAAAFGLPVFATDTGGVSEMVVNGETGFLFPIEAGGRDYAEKIQIVLTNADLYSRLRINARSQYELNLNWDVWGASCEKLLIDRGLLSAPEFKPNS
jgi:glycosyltransferase involved in cell wall biosynthesis